MRVRRIAVVVTCAAIATVVGWSPSANAAVKNVGLFGAQDPSFDGVYRQSLSLLALKAVGLTPDAASLAWFASQQCSDGTFTSYRSSVTTACAANEKDSNATGLALQAQKAAGVSTTKSIAGLKTFQDSDGGFYSNKLFSATPGSDANSTGIALAAFAAAGIDATTVTSGGKDGADFLNTVQLVCSAAASDRGAYDFQVESPLLANDFATAQAAQGALGAALPVAHQAGNATQPSMTCPGGPASSAEAAQDSAGYLARRLEANGGLIPSAFGGGSDYTSTANAVVSLVAAGVGSAQVTSALNALAANVDAYVKDSNGDDRPAALSWLILAAHAGGRDPHAFGGTNLVTRLLATEIKAPVVAPSPTPSSTGHATPAPSPSTAVSGSTLPATGGHDVLPMALVGVAVLLGGGALVWAGNRR
jgi:LPXTG-motif cell wall-anchored protein